MKPEFEYLDPKKYFTKELAEAYNSNSRIKKIQKEMTLRCLDFLDIKKGRILDAGCGTGISTQFLLEKGFDAVGIDISKPMIDIAKQKNLPCKVGDFRNLKFKNKEFDAIISISAIQWNPATSIKEAEKNYKDNAKEFYRVLKNNSKAVLQFYPKDKHDLKRILNCFKIFDKVTLATDEEDTKNEKKYLICEKY